MTQAYTPPEHSIADEMLLKYTYAVYILQAISFIMPVIPSIAAIIINYIKLEEVKDSWLASHFRWQMRTFWFSVLWAVIGGVLTLVWIGIPILFGLYVWRIYRVVKGIVYLMDKRAV